ncbi:YfhO family protein [bacterium]|nr:YfhO family protein [candidate division CSSED10-310 bacterium]
MEETGECHEDDAVTRVSKRFRGSCLPILLLCIPAVFLFRDMLCRGEIFLPGEALFGFPPWDMQGRTGHWIEFDLVLMFYPWARFVATWLSAGVIPLWNPWTMCGAPCLGAGQPAVCFPLTWLYIMDPLRSFGMVALLRLLAMLVGFYLWMRALGLAQWSAILGALSFSFGGYNQYALGRANANVSLCLPWFAFFAARAPSSRSAPLFLAAAALALGLGGLGGHVESSFYLYVFAGTYLVHLYRRRPLAAAGALFFCLITALLVAGIQLYPFLDYLSQSVVFHVRSGAISAVDGMPLSYLVTLTAPEMFGNPWDGTYRAARLTYYEITGGFGGVTALLFAILAVFGPDRRRWFFIAWFLAALCGAYDVPLLSHVIRSLPGFSLAYCVRMSFLGLTCLAVLASIGLDDWLRGVGSGFRRRIAATMRASGISLRLALGGVLAAVPLLFAAFGASAATGGEVLTWWRYGWCAGPLLAAVALSCSPLQRRPVAAAGIALVAALELLAFAGRHNDWVPASLLYPRTGGIEYLAANTGNGRIAAYGKALYPNTGMVYGLADVRGYDSLAPRRFVEAIGVMDPSQLIRRPDNVMQSVELYRFTQPMCSLLGVRYVAFPQAAGEKAMALAATGRFRAVYADDLIVLENEKAMDEVFFIPGPPLPVADARVIMAAPAFDPAIVVPVDSTSGFSCPHPVPVPMKNAPSIVTRNTRPGRIDAHCRTAEPGMLVVTQNALHGWRATIDESPVEVCRAYHSFMGIVLPAGVHDVMFSYAPFSFRIGSFASLLGFLVLAAVAVFHYRSVSK